MVSTFAVESYVANFDLEERISQARSYQFYTEEVGLSNNSEHAEQINHYTRLASIIKRIKSDYFVLTGVDHSKSLQAFVGDSKEEDIQAFLQQLEYPEFDKKLSRIKIGDVLTKDDFDIGEDIYSDIIGYSYLDAEEFCDVAIEISFNGDLYYLFMLTAKLDGRWYNITSCSPLGLLCGADSSDGLMKQ